MGHECPKLGESGAAARMTTRPAPTSALFHNNEYAIASTVFMASAIGVAIFLGSLLGALVTIAVWRVTRPSIVAKRLLNLLEPVASFVRPGQSACFGCLRLPIPIPGDEISHAVAALKARLAIPGLGFIVLDGAAGASRERAAWRALRPAVAESFAREEERGEGVEWYSLTVP
jgi:hypothetical protein